jgi:hypothetical protein
MWLYKCVICCECQIEEFTQEFIEMKSTLDMGITINTAVVSLQIHRTVDFIVSSSSAFFIITSLTFDYPLVEAPTPAGMSQPGLPILQKIYCGFTVSQGITHASIYIHDALFL